MSEFTSGTWSVGIDVKCGPYIYADDGEAIIAVIRNCGHISELNKKETVRQANARLIAAAPEMYELVKEMARPNGKNCYLLEQQAKKLLARIGCEEDSHE